MGQKSSKEDEESIHTRRSLQKNSKLSNRIKSRLDTFNKDIKSSIETNYAISNYNSNSYLAYNIKKAEEGTHEIQFNWYQYAEEECDLIKQGKSYGWLEDTILLLDKMKKDPKVKEFQRSALMSLIYTIESMTEMDYLVDVPNESQEELFDQHKTNQEDTDQLNNFRKQRTGTSLFSNSQNLDTLEDSFLQYRTSQYTKNEINQHRLHNGQSKEKNFRTNKDNQNNLKTLVERIPVFEEELKENVQGTKIDTNLLRSEVCTVLPNEGPPVLCYSQSNEEMQLARKTSKPQVMNNHTILLGDPIKAASPQLNTATSTPSCSGRSLRSSQDSTEADGFSDAVKMVNFYKRIYIFLERQLERKYNPIRAMMKLFKKHFVKTYGYLVDQQSNSSQISVESKRNQQKNQDSNEILEQTKLKGSVKVVSKSKEANRKQSQSNNKQQTLPINLKQSDQTIKCTQASIALIVEDIIAETQQFLHFLLYCVIFFYDFDNILPQKQYSQLVNKENLWNFLINILFADEDIFSTMFSLIKTSLAENERQLNNKLIELKDVGPQHLELHPRFCLNKKTINWYADKHLNNKQTKTNNNDNKKGFSQKNEMKDPEEEQKYNEINNYDQIKYSNQTTFDQPYSKAILKLSDLPFYNSPIHKMKLLVQCFEQIPICIEEFYKQNFSGFDGQNLIASDDLINILVYIVLKSGVSDLNSHLKLISSFLSKSTQSSKIGYYCTSLMIVANYLESDRIFESIDKMREQSRIIERSLLSMNNQNSMRSALKQKISEKSAIRSNSPQKQISQWQG